MKIEAKKSKYNLNKSLGKHAAQSSGAEQAAEKSGDEKPGLNLPKINIPRIKVPKIKLPRIALPKIPMPAIKFPKLRIPKLKGRKSVYVIALLVAVPAAIMAVWLGMNLIRRPVPKPLFTERDLPPAPPAESNGFAYINDDQTVNEYARKDISDNNLFRNAASIEIFLDKTRAEYAMVKTLANRDDVKKMIELHDDIMKKPIFADTVMPNGNDVQKVRVYVALHNSLTAAIITRMQEKKSGAAFKLMKDQLNLNAQYVLTARSMNTYLTGIQAYEKSLNILKSMLNQYSGAMKMGNDAVAACRDIGNILRSFNPQSIQLARIVVFEYILLWKQTFNPAIRHPEASAYQGMKRKALFFFDRGLTQRLFDERWKKLYECAKNPTDNTLLDVNKIQEQQYAAGRFWWFHNAVGKKYLDTLAMPVYQLFAESKNWTTVINRTQGEIMTVIDSLKEETKPEKKQIKKQKKIKRKPAA